MRWLLVFLLAASAAVLSVGAASAPAVDRTPPPVIVAGGGGYPVHLKFNLTYEVEWGEAAGSATRDTCDTWRTSFGKLIVVAHDAPWKRPTERRAVRHGIPGQLIFAGSLALSQWAGGSIVGPAKATVHRTWVQNGGPDAGCPGVTQPWSPTPDDCGDRTFTTRAASVMPAVRRGTSTLADLTTTPANPRSSDSDVLSFTVSPSRDLYRSCATAGGVPDYPANLGMLLKKGDALTLRGLDPGDGFRRSWVKTGDCDEDLPDGTTCTYRIEVYWELFRWDAKSRFP